jgi:hypothetical protein
VENIDEGVVEAIRATGAGYTQMLSSPCCHSFAGSDLVYVVSARRPTFAPRPFWVSSAPAGLVI